MKTLTNRELQASLRVVEREGQPWFVAKDICQVLGIQNIAQAVGRLDEDEVCQAYVLDSRGQSQKTYVVSESGMYALILRSDKPAARQFRKWVTSEVLPEIRQTGSYAGGWERELARLESDCNASRALVVECEEKLARFRILVAKRLGLSAGVLEVPEVPVNQPDGRRPSRHLSSLAKRMPLPMKTKPLVAWIMQNEKIKEKAARQRVLRMYRSSLIIQGSDGVVRLLTQEPVELSTKKPQPLISNS